MAVKGRSARGRIVDFDLLKIKQQIGAQPSTNNVRARQDFIEKKIHRGRVKKFPKATTVPSVNVEPLIPGTDNIIVENKPNIEDNSQNTTTKKGATKQNEQQT